MQILEQTLSLPLQPLNTLNTFSSGTGERYCFFDIETTGLSPKISSLYLIGALWYEPESDTIRTRQWFADDYTSETDIISSFADFLTGFTTLVHYNGSGFDIPYIEKKCISLGIPSPFANVKSLDIFREIRKLKSLFGVPDLKLPTVEKKTGFVRSDRLTGKECIQVYSDFMQKKYLRDDAMKTEQQKLLQHNIDDITGTFLSARMLSYKCSGTPEHLDVADGSVRAVFSLSCPVPFPACHTSYVTQKPSDSPYDVPTFSIRFEGSHIELELPLLSGTFCHFFPNYKDYFYLPAEDTAIHKSVGAYVEKQFREPAKASNCYIKKEGIFLPVPNGFQPENRILFRPDYRSRQNYLLWEEKNKQDLSLMEEILLRLTASI